MDKKYDNINTDIIKNITSEYFNISYSDLISNKRNKQYSYPRKISMYLIRKFCNISYKDIAKVFLKKDHSTVINSVKKIEKSILLDDTVRRDVSILEELLRADTYS